MSIPLTAAGWPPRTAGSHQSQHTGCPWGTAPLGGCCAGGFQCCSAHQWNWRSSQVLSALHILLRETKREIENRAKESHAGKKMCVLAPNRSSSCNILPLLINCIAYHSISGYISQISILDLIFPLLLVVFMTTVMITGLTNSRFWWFPNNNPRSDHLAEYHTSTFKCLQDISPSTCPKLNSSYLLSLSTPQIAFLPSVCLVLVNVITIFGIRYEFDTKLSQGQLESSLQLFSLPLHVITVKPCKS